MHISASVLACAPFELKESVIALNDAEVDSIHYDVMDGHYVSSITGDSRTCKAIAEVSSLPVYVHLMVDNPLHQIDQFAYTGAKGIAFHPMLGNDNNSAIRLIKSHGLLAGVAIANKNELNCLTEVDNIDYIIIMTVVPGCCGQDIQPNLIDNIAEVKRLKPGVCIFADGGINEKTVHMVSNIDGIIVGSYLFRGVLKEQVKKLRDIL